MIDTWANVPLQYKRVIAIVGNNPLEQHIFHIFVNN